MIAESVSGFARATTRVRPYHDSKAACSSQSYHGRGAPLWSPSQILALRAKIQRASISPATSQRVLRCVYGRRYTIVSNVGIAPVACKGGVSMNEFRYTGYAQEVIFGPGSLTRLSEAIERFGWRRLALCSSGSLRRDGTIAAMQSALGERLVAIYDRTQSHVPESQVEEVVALARRSDVDALIGMGGGSPLGLSKAVAFALEERRGSEHLSPNSPIAQPHVAVIAIP